MGEGKKARRHEEREGMRFIHFGALRRSKRWGIVASRIHLITGEMEEGRQRDKSRREQRVSEVEKEGERETGTTLCIDRAVRFNVDLCKRIMDAKSALRITRRDCELLDATIRRLGRRK